MITCPLGCPYSRGNVIKYPNDALQMEKGCCYVREYLMTCP